MRKETVAIVILAIGLVITVSINIWQYNSNQQLTARLDALNQSFITLNHQFDTRNLLYANLWNQFYSGGIVASLSNSSEFRNVASTMGARYFSINPDISYSNNSTQVDGYIWTTNGTFILLYGAVVDLVTFQVVNVVTYEPLCIGCPENMTYATPDMSNYTIYIIQPSSFGEIIHPNFHLLTSQEIAQLYPNLPSAEQLWDNGTGTWINPQESQSGVTIHFGNNASMFIAGAIPSDEIMNYTEFIPDYFTGLHAGQYAHVWLQYNDTIWVEAPLVKVSD
jgi:hypothetical protein